MSLGPYRGSKRIELQLVTRHLEPVCELVADYLSVKVSCWPRQLSEKYSFDPLWSYCDEAGAIQSLPESLHQSSLSSCEARGFWSFGASLLDKSTCFSSPKHFV